MEKLEFSKVLLKNTDIRLAALDDFNDFYGWEVYGNIGNFVLYDSQCSEIVDLYHSRYEIIDRICTRALDYWLEEHEFDDNKLHISDYRMISNLMFIYQLYVSDLDYLGNKDWYKEKLKVLKDLEVYE